MSLQLDNKGFLTADRQLESVDLVTPGAQSVTSQSLGIHMACRCPARRKRPLSGLLTFSLGGPASWLISFYGCEGRSTSQQDLHSEHYKREWFRVRSQLLERWHSNSYLILLLGIFWRRGPSELHVV